LTVEIIFETHSITTGNERGIATGWLDSPLSETGKQFAKELGDRRRGDNVAAVFTSDLGRAVETAKIAFVGSGIPIHQDSRLRECNYGVFNGTTVSQLEAQRSRHIDEPFPSGESYRQVVDRVEDFLNDVSRKWDGKRIVVIGHSASRWALDHLLCGAAIEDLVNAPFSWQEGWLYALR
jgi:alpha-ribazole phosphatase/probable phosphoglycerate mutase